MDTGCIAGLWSVVWGGGGVYSQPLAVPIVSALQLTACALVRPSSVVLIHVSSELRERNVLLVCAAFSAVHFCLVSCFHTHTLYTQTHTHTHYIHMHTHTHTRTLYTHTCTCTHTRTCTHMQTYAPYDAHTQLRGQWEVEWLCVIEKCNIPSGTSALDISFFFTLFITTPSHWPHTGGY